MLLQQLPVIVIRHRLVCNIHNPVELPDLLHIKGILRIFFSL